MPVHSERPVDSQSRSASDDRKDSGRGDVGEVAEKHLVRDAEVEGRREDRGVGARRGCVLRQRDRFPRGAGRGPCVDRDSAGRLGDDNLGDAPPLLPREMRELARPAGRHDPVHTPVDDVPHEPAERGLVHVFAVGGEGRGNRWDDAVKVVGREHDGRPPFVAG
jgi:hypothetical protein